MLTNFLCEKRRELTRFFHENTIWIGLAVFFIGALLVIAGLLYVSFSGVVWNAKPEAPPLICTIGEIATIVGFFMFFVEALRGKL